MPAADGGFTGLEGPRLPTTLCLFVATESEAQKSRCVSHKL